MAIGRALMKLGRHHRLSEHTVREVWQIAGEKAFAANAAPSSICEDRTPVEVSVALGPRPGGLRYLTELGEGKEGWERLADSRKKLPRLLEVLGLPPQPLLRLVDELISKPPDQSPPLHFGMWVSPVLLPGRNQLKVYINTVWRGSSDVWQRVFRLLELTVRSEAGEKLKSLLPELKRFRRFSFMGLENTTDGLRRVKLYLRGTTLTREGMVRIARLAGDASELLARLWQVLLADHEIGPKDVVLSISIPEGNQPLRVKVDVAAKQLGLPDNELPPWIKAVVRAEALDPADYLVALEALANVAGLPPQHTVIGISTLEDRPRINVYLKPVF